MDLIKLWLLVKGSEVHLREIGEAIKSKAPASPKSSLDLSSKLYIYCAPESRAITTWGTKYWHAQAHRAKLLLLKELHQKSLGNEPKMLGPNIHQQFPVVKVLLALIRTDNVHLSSPFPNCICSSDKVSTILYCASWWHSNLVWKSKLKNGCLCGCGLPVAFGVSKPLLLVELKMTLKKMTVLTPSWVSLISQVHSKITSPSKSLWTFYLIRDHHLQ